MRRGNLTKEEGSSSCGKEIMIAVAMLDSGSAATCLKKIRAEEADGYCFPVHHFLSIVGMCAWADTSRFYGYSTTFTSGRCSSFLPRPSHLSFDLWMIATKGPLGRSYTPNRPSTGRDNLCPGEPSAMPASFLRTTVTRAPGADSGPRAIDRH